MQLRQFFRRDRHYRRACSAEGCAVAPPVVRYLGAGGQRQGIGGVQGAAPPRPHGPGHSGRRFSRKAPIPSAASGAAMFSAMAREAQA